MRTADQCEELKQAVSIRARFLGRAMRTALRNVFSQLLVSIRARFLGRAMPGTIPSAQVPLVFQSAPGF